ncbi:unnamed protein product, partial [Prorocentrum cordatum]
FLQDDHEYDHNLGFTPNTVPCPKTLPPIYRRAIPLPDIEPSHIRRSRIELPDAARVGGGPGGVKIPLEVGHSYFSHSYVGAEPIPPSEYWPRIDLLIVKPSVILPIRQPFGADGNDKENPQIQIAGGDGNPVAVTRSIAELCIRVFSHMPINEVIARKNSRAAQDSTFRQQVQEAEAAWASRANRTSLDTVSQMGQGDNVSVGFGSMVKVKRKVAILNRLEFKYHHDGQEPLQRLVRHHPTMMLPVRGATSGEQEKVWLFEVFPGARRTMSFTTFHKVTAGSTPVRPEDVFYLGQVADFYNKGLADQNAEFDFDVVGKDLPTINDTREKYGLPPIDPHQAVGSHDAPAAEFDEATPPAAAAHAGGGLVESLEAAIGGGGGALDASLALAPVIQLPSAFGKGADAAGGANKRRRVQKMPAAPLEASPGSAGDIAILDDVASVAGSTQVGNVSATDSVSDMRQGPYKHISNLNCEAEMLQGNLGNLLSHAQKWVRENSENAAKWGNGMSDLKSRIAKFEMAHIVSVRHQDSFTDAEVAKAVRYMIHFDGKLPPAVNLKLCMRAAKKSMGHVRDAATFSTFFGDCLPFDPSCDDEFDSDSPRLCALDVEAAVKIHSFMTSFMDSWLCPILQQGDESRQLFSAALSAARERVALVVAEDMPDEYMRFFCSLSEAFDALAFLTGDASAMTLDDISEKVKVHVALLSDQKSTDPIVSRIVRSISATPVYMDLLSDLSKASQGMQSMGRQLAYLHSALTADDLTTLSSTEEWRKVLECHGNIAKDMLAMVDALGSMFGDGLKGRALMKAEVVVKRFLDRAHHDAASEVEAEAFSKMVSYQRLVWHDLPCFLDAESEAADLIVSLRSQATVASFAIAVQAAADATDLTQEIMETAQRGMEQVRGSVAVSETVQHHLETLAARCIKIAIDVSVHSEAMRTAALNALAAALDIMPQSVIHKGVVDVLRQHNALAVRLAEFKAKHAAGDGNGIDLDAAYQCDGLSGLKGCTTALSSLMEKDSFPDVVGDAALVDMAVVQCTVARTLVDEVANYGLKALVLKYQSGILAELDGLKGGLKNGADWVDGLSAPGATEKWDKIKSVGVATLLADGVAVGLRKKVAAA